MAVQVIWYKVVRNLVNWLNDDHGAMMTLWTQLSCHLGKSRFWIQLVIDAGPNSTRDNQYIVTPCIMRLIVLTDIKVIGIVLVVLLPTQIITRLIRSVLGLVQKVSRVFLEYYDSSVIIIQQRSKIVQDKFYLAVFVDPAVVRIS